MDNETGETVQPQLSEAMLDMETGELTSEEMEIKPIGIRKAKFSVPKQYLSKPLTKKPKNKCDLTYSLTSKEKVLELKEVIPISARKALLSNTFFSGNYSWLQPHQSSFILDSVVIFLSPVCCNNFGYR